MPADSSTMSSAPPQISRMCAACEEEDSLHRKSIAPAKGGQEAPSVVHEVLRSPGEPLNPIARAYFEPRFGQDFSHVRVHTDRQAARSASAINARAYTVGNDLVFAAGQFQPTVLDGRRLLAHELAHVVSQSRCAPYIQRAPARGGREGTDFRCGDVACNKQTSNNTFPTWAGEFIVDEYCVTQDEGESGNGVYLVMRFKPNNYVNAMQIAFVQTAQSKSGSKLVTAHEETLSEKEKNIVHKRMIPDKQPGGGTHIDQMVGSRTPLLGMRDVFGTSSLGDFTLSTPPSISTPGFHYIDEHGNRHSQDASMHDCPSLPRVPGVAQQQVLETAALAVTGAQQQVFYGSVRWGWKMGPKDNQATGLPIEVVKYAPSSVFAAAAELWNQSPNVIAVPQSMYKVVAHTVDLWDDPSKAKRIGRLAKDTIVGVTDFHPKRADWQNVVVVSGPLTAKTGWVQKTDITPFSTDLEKEKLRR